jgi:thioredoxin-like negative regulator of GroEL
MKSLVLFSREDCDHCDRLAEALSPLIAGRAKLEVVDIDDDPALVERYGLRIPVLVGGNNELSGFPLDVDRVERYLAESDG